MRDKNYVSDYHVAHLYITQLIGSFEAYTILYLNRGVHCIIKELFEMVFGTLKLAKTH